MSILDTIVADTRTLVAQRRRERPLRTLEDAPGCQRATLPFAPALRRADLAFIAELKKASPSKGVIREDFDVEDLAVQYAEAGAAALSVLTEPLHFKGSLDNLARVRRCVDLPLLRKDFIVDPYQLVEARAYGADAVLLIAAVLDAAQLHDLHQAAEELGLGCLVELYEQAELERIDLSQVRVLGVNNRDLRTFEVDVNHSLRVFAHVPPGIVRVSESGLSRAEELTHLRRHGIDAVLIGESLMRAERPGRRLAALREEVARPHEA